MSKYNNWKPTSKLRKQFMNAKIIISGVVSERANLRVESKERDIF